ncbi:hypothetical protein AVEN_221244-1 [Araneus ventricosus]|uniref:Uncharacterized protein n=1 Tax=Araneus ventricosus TaxID=182803 RepID=A0A4Y2F8Y9_ARAVE|nr:hypothetical protein AVEN_221244-1 [Araneus ventricosus]
MSPLTPQQPRRGATTVNGMSRRSRTMRLVHDYGPEAASISIEVSHGEKSDFASMPEHTEPHHPRPSRSYLEFLLYLQQEARVAAIRRPNNISLPATLTTLVTGEFEKKETGRAAASL